MGQQRSAEGTEIAYEIEDKPPIGEAIARGVQHVFVMVLGNVVPPLLIAGGIGLGTGETAFLVQMALFAAGGATLVQVYSVGAVGARLPLMMGTSFVFIGPLTGIGEQFGLAAVFGACLTAAVVEIGVGCSYDRVDRFIPPLVGGIVVMLVGLTLVPTGIEYAAGGPNAHQYGSFVNLGLAALVFFLTLVVNQMFDGILRIGSVFVGILVGYVVAIPLGVVDFSPVTQASWIAVPVPLKYGVAFEPGAIVTVALLYAVVGRETIGDVTGTVVVVDREPTETELRGGLFADGVMSAVGAMFGAFPTTSFSQNVGVITVTRVLSRHVVGIGGLILFIAGFVPKIGALGATIPDAVLGGGALFVFAMIFASGVGIIERAVELTHRNMMIVAVSVALGLAVEHRPAAIGTIPALFRPLFSSGLIIGSVSAFVLTLVSSDEDESDGTPGRSSVPERPEE